MSYSLLVLVLVYSILLFLQRSVLHRHILLIFISHSGTCTRIFHFAVNVMLINRRHIRSHWVCGKRGIRTVGENTYVFPLCPKEYFDEVLNPKKEFEEVRRLVFWYTCSFRYSSTFCLSDAVIKILERIYISVENDSELFVRIKLKLIGKSSFFFFDFRNCNRDRAIEPGLILLGWESFPALIANCSNELRIFGILKWPQTSAGSLHATYDSNKQFLKKFSFFAIWQSIFVRELHVCETDTCRLFDSHHSS